MGLREDALGNNGNGPLLKGERVKSKIGFRCDSVAHKKNKNYKQILILSVDAIRERKLNIGTYDINGHSRGRFNGRT
ncbi:MAG: hypothetical protein WA364_15115 [Candidatus Nitrosopolaris sp.]